MDLDHLPDRFRIMRHTSFTTQSYHPGDHKRSMHDIVSSMFNSVEFFIE